MAQIPIDEIFQNSTQKNLDFTNFDILSEHLSDQLQAAYDDLFEKRIN